MKRLLLFILLSAPLIVLGQSDTITFSQTQNIETAEAIKNQTPFKVYISSDGTKFIVGDKLKLGAPGGNFNSSSNQSSQNYQYIMQGRLTTGNLLLSKPQMLNQVYKGRELNITEIRVGHTKLKKASTLQVYVFLEDRNITNVLGSKNSTIVDLEKAIEYGEVTTQNRVLTRTEAIAKLKEAKDLVDLGMMSKVDFEALKVKLTPIISKTN